MERWNGGTAERRNGGTREKPFHAPIAYGPGDSRSVSQFAEDGQTLFLSCPRQRKLTPPPGHITEITPQDRDIPPVAERLVATPVPRQSRRKNSPPCQQFGPRERFSSSGGTVGTR
ncbi:MAG: hypothetical protein H7Z41_17895 [Cytophagales bacterium]|nr:hypothetical protein [Armatimonadota bacterium]